MEDPTMRNPTLLLLCLPLLLGQTCTLTSDLDKYDDYQFADKNKSDAGKDGGKDAGKDGGEPDAGDAEETWWQRYDKLSGEASPECGEVTEKHLYCTGGVELEVDLACPDHCHAVTGRHCFCPYGREYQDAAEICRSKDMHLVKIDDREENEALGGLMLDMGMSSDEETFGPNGVNAAVWIGLNDLDKEGTFVWPDGSETAYQPWAFNQPDNLTGPEGEDCVAMQPGEGAQFFWHDYPCESYEGMEMERRSEAGHFFLCETADVDKEIGRSSVAFISQNSGPCQIPSSQTPGETCCTTVADVARSAAVEPGRCGLMLPSLPSMCTQFCHPGKVDYESGCPENLFFVGAPPYPPCCTMLGNDSAGYLCGFWESTGSGGCLPNGSATTTCPKPTAYKGPDEPLVKWNKCGDQECVLDNPQELAWADQCCTEPKDLELLLASEPGQCGMKFTNWGSEDCVQLNQKGVLDQSCPSLPLAPNSPMPEVSTMTRPGCCTDLGVCGGVNPASNLGCRANRNSMEEPYRLCRRANKGENLGVDPLLNEINYVYRDDAAGIREVRSKDYGDCDDPIQYNQSSYYFCRGPLAWEQARAACEWKKDRFLVRVDDADENDFLHERFSNSPFWIGAYMNDMSISDEWRWSDTEEPFFMGIHYQCAFASESILWRVIESRYVNWVGCGNSPEEQPQPNDDEGIEENCAQMRPDGYWSDEDCSIEQAYVCEDKG